MPNITLSIPDNIYRKMKKYSEIKWSEVVRKAIVDYLKKLEESKTEISTKELLEDLGNDFKKSLEELNFERTVEGYKKMREKEWERFSTTQVN
jgi:Arc/MetJ-type ribon-helix-helix transcriptional regulator